MSSTEEKKLPNMTTVSNLRQESKTGETKAGTGYTLYLYDMKNNCEVLVGEYHPEQKDYNLWLCDVDASDNIDWDYLDRENGITLEQQIRNYFFNNSGIKKIDNTYLYVL